MDNKKSNKQEKIKSNPGIVRLGNAAKLIQGGPPAQWGDGAAPPNNFRWRKG